MEKFICPKCNRPLRSANAWHYCQEVDIDSLFVDKSDAIVLAFDTIFREVTEWENVDYSATKNCVVFLHNTTFLLLKPMKNWLEVKFYSDTILDEEKLHKQAPRGKKFEAIFRFEFEEQIDPKYFEYFRKSYLIC